MWQHNYIPVAGSLGLSALVAALPIFVLLLLLGVMRRPAWIAGVGMGSLGLAWGVLAVADLARVQGLAIEAVGAVAALAALLVARRGLAPPGA